MSAILGENAPNWLCPTAPSYKSPVSAEPEMKMRRDPEFRLRKGLAPAGYIGMRAAATKHGMSYRTIKNAVQRGKIKSIKIGVSVFIPMDGVDLYIAKARKGDRKRILKAKKARLDESGKDGIIT
jgi:hypothetical protein